MVVQAPRAAARHENRARVPSHALVREATRGAFPVRERNELETSLRSRSFIARHRLRPTSFSGTATLSNQKRRGGRQNIGRTQDVTKLHAPRGEQAGWIRRPVPPILLQNELVQVVFSPGAISPTRSAKQGRMPVFPKQPPPQSNPNPTSLIISTPMVMSSTRACARVSTASQ